MKLRTMIAAASFLAAAVLVVAVRWVGPEVGLVGGALRPCPASPNCVSSEAPEGDPSRVGPLPIPEGMEPEEAFERLALLVSERASVRTRTPSYLHAVFTTRLLRFRDDFEARLDAGAGVIHVRSASRLGYSDLGANRRRVEAIRAAFRSGPN